MSDSRTTASVHAWTRCDQCKSDLPVTFADVAQSGGMVRCGHCGRTFSALTALYPQPATQDGQAFYRGALPPMIQPWTESPERHDIEHDTKDDTESNAENDDAEDLPEDLAERGDKDQDKRDIESPDRRGPILDLDLTPDPPPIWQRLLWPALALTLLAVAMLQLFGPERWRLDLPIPGMGHVPVVAAEHAISVVSRDMHPHPSLDNAWVISTVLLNQSSQPVPWPTIELSLFDASQQRVAARSLRPSDYLEGETASGGRFGAGLRLPVVLRIATDGSRPTGFSMRFAD